MLPVHDLSRHTEAANLELDTMDDDGHIHKRQQFYADWCLAHSNDFNRDGLSIVQQLRKSLH